MNVPAAAQITAPAEPNSMQRVHDLLAQFWDQCGSVTLHERIRFETATVEIANNIAEHVDTETFTLKLAANSEALEALFVDSGPQLRFDPLSRTLPEELAESGRGLALACAAVDEVHYLHEAHQNRWRLVLHRSAGPG